MDIICDGDKGSWVGLLHDLLEFIKFSSGDNSHQNSFFFVIVGSLSAMDYCRPTMQLVVNLINHSVWMAGDNHGLHTLLLGKDRIRHSARHKNSNHGVQRILPAKGQTRNQHNNSINNQGNIPDISARFFPNSQTDNISPTAGNAGLKGKANPRSHDHTAEKGVDNRIISQGHFWHKLDKERAHRNRDKGENGKLMPNLVPGQNHQRNINSVKGHRNRNGKTKETSTEGSNDLRQTSRPAGINMSRLKEKIDCYS